MVSVSAAQSATLATADPAFGQKTLTANKFGILIQVARELMLLRDEFLNLPILLLASHSRGEAKKPYAPGRGYGAYKESGDVEYSSDRCFNLEYTDEEYDRWRTGGINPRAVELSLVACKNRLGRMGRLGVDFNGCLQKFVLGQPQIYSGRTGGADGQS
jgi:hypothetical protein